MLNCLSFKTVIVVIIVSITPAVALCQNKQLDQALQNIKIINLNGLTAYTYPEFHGSVVEAEKVYKQGRNNSPAQAEILRCYEEADALWADKDPERLVNAGISEYPQAKQNFDALDAPVISEKLRKCNSYLK